MWVEAREGAAWLWSRVAVDYVHGGPALAASVASLAAVFAAAVLIELLAVGWQASGLRKLLAAGASARCDLATALVLQTPVVGHLGVLMSGGLSLWALHHLRAGLLPLGPGGGPAWLRALACLVVLDLVYYVVHRLMHAWEPLWQLHRFHHAATEATLLTALRVHPLESAICGIAVAVPLGLLGGSEGGWLFFATQLLALLRHSNLPWTWGWVGAYGLISPAGHRVHHASDPACFDTNFGVLFPWWDRLFGTWRAPTAALPPIGVAGDALATQGWAAGVWTCYVDFWQALGRAARLEQVLDLGHPRGYPVVGQQQQP